MPKNILKWFPRPNVVRIQENFEATRAQQIVQLNSSVPRFHSPVTHKYSSLTPKQPNAL